MTVTLCLEIVEKMAVIFAALAAIYGINTWKREASWKREFELKEEVLTLFYEVRDAIERIRSPFSSIGEGSSRKVGKYETPEEKQIRDRAYVAYERYEKEQALFNNLRKKKYRFMAVYGNQYSKAFLDLDSVLNRILLASAALGQYYWQPVDRQRMGKKEMESHLVEMRKHESFFWSSGSKDDEVRKQVNNVIDTIEKVFEKRLR